MSIIQQTLRQTGGTAVSERQITFPRVLVKLEAVVRCLGFSSMGREVANSWGVLLEEIHEARPVVVR